MVQFMRIKDQLYMHPLKKYQKYGAFPWKLVVQMLLVLLTSCQIVLIVNESTTYAYNQYLIFNKLFLNHEAQGSDIVITNTFNLYSIPSLTNYIQTSVNRYYDINSYTIDNYQYFYDENTGLKSTPKLLVSYFDNAKALKAGYEFKYPLFTNNLGPFSSKNIDDFLHQVKEFYIEFKLVHKLPKYVDLSDDCFKWTVKQKYNFNKHGTVIAELITDRVSCEDINYNILHHYIWLSLFVLFLAAVSLVLVIREILKSLRIVSGVKDGSGSTSKAWEQLGLIDKLKFFNFWLIFGFLGNLFQIFGGILTLIDNNTYLNTHEIIIGFGCFFAWIGIVRFIHHDSDSYLIVITIQRSASLIALYITGVVPIFMGYAFLAICLFWQTGIYYSTPMSLIANFALVNGDSVYAFNFAGYQQHGFMGQLYYYTFIVFFICCVHNLFIAIVEQTFSRYRQERRENPVDSDSDEELPQGAMSPRQKRMAEYREKKSRSVLAFKKILNAGRRDTKEMFDENTLNVVQQMDQLVQKIITSAESLKELMKSPSATADELKFLRERVEILINSQIFPILEHFN